MYKSGKQIVQKCLEEGDVKSVLYFMERRLNGKGKKVPGAERQNVYVSIGAIRKSKLKRSQIKLLATHWRPYAEKVSNKRIPRLPDWSDDEVCWDILRRIETY